MIRAFEKVEVPVGDFTTFESKVADMRDIGLPLFGVACPEGMTPEAMITTTRPMLANEGFVLSDSHPTLRTESAANEFGLHMDSFSDLHSSHHADTLHEHFTTKGGVMASFLEPTDAFMEQGGDLPDSAHDLFAKGLVDDTQLKPKCFEITVHSPGLIVFRLFGKRPLAHRFKSTAYPRESYVFSAAYDPASLR